jgi:hypothetical protein
MLNDITHHHVAVFREPIQGWWLAVCADCEPVLPQPFRDEDAAREWQRQHEGHDD